MHNVVEIYILIRIIGVVYTNIRYSQYNKRGIRRGEAYNKLIKRSTSHILQNVTRRLPNEHGVPRASTTTNGTSSDVRPHERLHWATDGGLCGGPAHRHHGE